MFKLPKKNSKLPFFFFFSCKICLIFLLRSSSSPQNKTFSFPTFLYCYPSPKMLSQFSSPFSFSFFLQWLRLSTWIGQNLQSDHQLQRSFVWKEEANRDTEAKQVKLFCKSFLKGLNLHPSIVLSILPKHFYPAPLKMKAFLVIPFFLNSSDTILPILTCTLAVKRATYIMIQYQSSISIVFQKKWL